MPKNVFLDEGLDYSGSTLYFNLYRNGVLVQDGFMTAYDFPIKIYLNRYAQPFLGNNFPGVEQGVVADPDASGDFDMQDIGGNTVVSETYISAYAGDFNELMAEPIDGKADPRQKLYLSQYSDTSKSVEIEEDCCPDGECCGYYVKLEQSRLVGDKEYLYVFPASSSGLKFFYLEETNLPIVIGEDVPMKCWLSGGTGWDLENYVQGYPYGDYEEMLEPGYNPYAPSAVYMYGISSAGTMGAYAVDLRPNIQNKVMECWLIGYREGADCLPDERCRYFTIHIVQDAYEGGQDPDTGTTPEYVFTRSVDAVFSKTGQADTVRNALQTFDNTVAGMHISGETADGRTIWNSSSAHTPPGWYFQYNSRGGYYEGSSNRYFYFDEPVKWPRNGKKINGYIFTW